LFKDIFAHFQFNVCFGETHPDKNLNSRKQEKKLFDLPNVNEWFNISPIKLLVVASLLEVVVFLVL
jgi:hypothetical protein